MNGELHSSYNSTLCKPDLNSATLKLSRDPVLRCHLLGSSEAFLSKFSKIENTIELKRSFSSRIVLKR